MHQLLTTSGQIVSANDSECIIIKWDKAKNVVTSGSKWIEVGRGDSYIGWGIDVNIRMQSNTSLNLLRKRRPRTNDLQTILMKHGHRKSVNGLTSFRRELYTWPGPRDRMCWFLLTILAFSITTSILRIRRSNPLIVLFMMLIVLFMLLTVLFMAFNSARMAAFPPWSNWSCPSVG